MLITWTARYWCVAGYRLSTIVSRFALVVDLRRYIWCTRCVQIRQLSSKKRRIVQIINSNGQTKCPEQSDTYWACTCRGWFVWFDSFFGRVVSIRRTRRISPRSQIILTTVIHIVWPTAVFSRLFHRSLVIAKRQSGMPVSTIERVICTEERLCLKTLAVSVFGRQAGLVRDRLWRARPR